MNKIILSGLFAITIFCHFHAQVATQIEEVKLTLTASNGAISDEVFMVADMASTTMFTNKLDAQKASTSLIVLKEEEFGLKYLGINGISGCCYIAKPIAIVLNGIDGNKYTFTVSIRIDSTKDNPKSNFYLVDKKEKRVIKIASDLAYKFTYETGDNDRFVAYYKEVPYEKIGAFQVGGEMTIHGLVSVRGVDLSGTSMRVRSGGDVRVLAPLYLKQGRYGVDGGGVMALTYEHVLGVDTLSQYEQYGQLIQTSGTQNIGKLKIRTNVPVSRGMNTQYVEMSFPFEGEGLASMLNGSFGISNIVNSPNRYNQISWRWNNTKAQPEHDLSGNLSSGDVHTLNLTNAQMMTIVDRFMAKYTEFSGVANASLKQVVLTRQEAGTRTKLNYGVNYIDELPRLASNNGYVNDYGEPYTLYLYDPSSSKSEADFGMNVYYIPNPFPSNISITKLFSGATGDMSITTDNIKALAYTTEQGGTSGSSGGDFVAKFYIATCSGNGSVVRIDNCAGSLFSASAMDELMLRPMGTLAVKFMPGSFGQGATEQKTVNLVYDDSVKTSSYLGVIDLGRGNSTPSNGIKSEHAEHANSQLGGSDKIEELRLMLSSDSGYSDEVYLVADPGSREERSIKMDAEKSDKSLLSVLSEIDNSQHLLINGISKKEYQSRPIHLEMKTLVGDQYTLKGQIREGGDRDFARSNFYIEDKLTHKIMRVASDFVYKFKGTSKDGDRFVAYYGGLPAQLEEGIKGSTYAINIVTIEHATYLIFQGIEGKGKLQVYDALGSLVYVDGSVAMDQPYALSEIPNMQGVYIAKLITAQGVVTKKFVR